MNFICFNGKILPADKPALMADNRGYRYGDGLFETMKMVSGHIQLADLHYERLFSGMDTLKIKRPVLWTSLYFIDQVKQLAKKNRCEQLARIRLSVSRGNGGINDPLAEPLYSIECWPAGKSLQQLNENGLVLGVYREAKKYSGLFSGIKSANALIYVMAALYSKENKWNDALVLNEHGRIADSSIANIFIIKNEIIYTPPLTEGCVSGVMRKFLLSQLQNSGYTVKEMPVSIEDVQQADEVFLTNAMYGLKWVKQFQQSTYTCKQSAEIFQRFIQTI